MKESIAHKTSGLIGHLRNPRTGESMMVEFKPGVFEMTWEIQLISRTAPVSVSIEYLEGAGEYDVQIKLATRVPGHTIEAPSTPAPKAPEPITTPAKAPEPSLAPTLSATPDEDASPIPQEVPAGLFEGPNGGPIDPGSQEAQEGASTSSSPDAPLGVSAFPSDARRGPAPGAAQESSLSVFQEGGFSQAQAAAPAPKGGRKGR